MNHDVKAIWPQLYRERRRDWAQVEAPDLRFLAIDGAGDPNTSSAYAEAVAALYTLGYAVRAALKARTGDTFVVGPLEGLWTSDDTGSFVRREKDEWHWTMLIALPPVVEEADVTEGRAAALARRPASRIGEVRLETRAEGRCLQVLHVGPYDDEGPILARLHDELMPASGLTWNGPHHEIYLGDPRRVAPVRLRTVLRQPVRPVGPPATP